MAGPVAIKGLSELQRDMRRIGPAVIAGFRTELMVVAAPVRSDAERLSRQNISHIGRRWSQMRVGVTPSSVYVAPKARRRRGSPRRNLAPLLQREMDTALEQNADKIEERITFMYDHVVSRHGFR